MNRLVLLTIVIWVGGLLIGVIGTTVVADPPMNEPKECANDVVWVDPQCSPGTINVGDIVCSGAVCPEVCESGYVWYWRGPGSCIVKCIDRGTCCHGGNEP